MTDLKTRTFSDPNALVDFVRGGGLPALLKTAGNVFPMNLQGLALVVKISIDGGSTFPTTRTHTFTAATQAEKDFGTVGIGSLDSVFRSIYGGTEGNDITIVLIADSGLGDGVSISRSGKDFTIHYESTVSTIDDVEMAVGALTGSDLLIDVKPPGGTGATILVGADAFSATHLAGGMGPSYSSIDVVIADIMTDGAFMSTDFLVYAVRDELVIKTVVAGNRALKIDGTSTSIGVGLLQYTSSQIGNGAITIIVEILHDNSGKYVIFFT